MSDPQFVGPIDRLLYMRTLPQVAGLETRELAIIARQATEVYVRKGEIVLREGDPVDRMYVVVSGQIALTTHGVEIMRCLPGDNVGIIPALAKSEPRFEARATQDTVALSLDIDIMLAAMEENFHLFQNSLRSLARFHLDMMPDIIGGTRRAPWVGEGVKVPDRPLDVVERLVLLRRGNIFRNLGLEALVLMATSMEQQRWKAGTELWTPGEPADYLLVILDGECVGTLDDGTTFEAGRGYPLGNLETLARGERWYTAKATTDLITLRGNHEALFDVLEDDVDVAMHFIESVAAGAMNALERLAELGGPEAAPRMARVESA